MKYGFIFLVVSGGLAYLAIRHPVLSPLLGWCSASFLWTALAYLRFGASAFGKDSNGRIAWWSRVLNGPYFALTWLAWTVTRLLSSEEAYQRVDEYLTVGRRLIVSEARGECDGYLDLTAELEDPRPSASSRLTAACRFSMARFRP